jgi:hypothetical protein
MLPLSAFVCACPTVCLGSPHPCSLALVRACPTVRTLVLPFIWAAPVHAHQPSFVLVLLFVWAVPVCAHWPSFVLTTARSCSLLLAGPHAHCCSFMLSIRLLVPVLVWLSLVLVGGCFGFVGASFVLVWLSFGLIWAPQPLVCVCIKYMVSTYILNRLTFTPCIINLCKTID